MSDVSSPLLRDEELADELGEFSLAEARRIVGDFFRPNPWIYWTDFLVSWSVGIVAFYAVCGTPRRSRRTRRGTGRSRSALFVVSSLLFYRCSLFIHELVHIRADEFTAFRFVWNLLCGIPFLIPSFVYYTHIDHHRRKHYGTKEDGEYIPLAHDADVADSVLPVAGVRDSARGDRAVGLADAADVGEPAVSRLGAPACLVDDHGPQVHPPAADARRCGG